MSLPADHRLRQFANCVIHDLYYCVRVRDVLCALTFATVLLVVVLNLEFVSMTSHDVYINDLTNLPTMPAKLIHFRNVKTVYCLNEDILLEYALHAEVCCIHALRVAAFQRTLFCRKLLFVSAWSSVSCHTDIMHCRFILNIRANVFTGNTSI
jgi:hypothetical protein